MPPFHEDADVIVDLLGPLSAPVAVTFDDGVGDNITPDPQPAGCCFWGPARRRRIDTTPADHANCSVGSYTHGFIPLDVAAGGADTAALIGSGWVSNEDLMTAPALPMRPSSISYQPLAQADRADVVLVVLSPVGLMTLMGAVPDLTFVAKPQCLIVPLAYSGAVAMSPGCAVSRTRTGLSADEMTVAIPATLVAEVVDRLRRSVAADRTVSAFAAADMAENYAER